MRRCFLAASVFAILGLVTFPIISCGGGGSKQTLTASSPSLPPPAPPPPPPSGGSTPPSGAIVIDNIEDNPWLTCGACGNDGGTGPIAKYSATDGMVSPSEDGSSTQFAIAATVPFTNAYFYQTHNQVPAQQIGFLMYEFDLFIPNGFEAAPQAIEFECQQRLSGWVYNFSWQANYAENMWRIFNYGAKQWDETGIALTRFSAGTWHHIAAEFHNDVSTNSVWHDALTIDGVRTPVNIRHDAFFQGSSNEFSNAVQLDSNSLPTAYSVFVDKMKVTYK